MQIGKECLIPPQQLISCIQKNTNLSIYPGKEQDLLLFKVKQKDNVLEEFRQILEELAKDIK